MRWQERLDRIPDRAFFAGACALFLFIALGMGALAGIFSASVWSLGDTRIFLRMADLIVQGGTPYVDFKDPKPPLIFFLLAVPAALGAGLKGGLILVAAANWASAVILLAIGWRLYGRNAGLFAGLTFAIGTTWAQGYFVLTEPFALTLILLSVLLLFSGRRHRYLAAGVSAGLAIGFKQYAILLVPLALFYAWGKDEIKGLLVYLGGLLLVLAAMFAVVFLLYGTDAGFESLYWSFGMTSSYLTDGTIQDVPVYQIDSPAVAIAWIVLSLGFFFTPALLAVASILRWKPRDEEGLLVLAAVLFAATLLVRPFLHYWAFVLPFLILLASRAFGKQGSVLRVPVPRSTVAFAALSGIVSAALLFGSTAAAWVLMNGQWRPRSILELYGLADLILKATSGYFGHLPEHVAVHLHSSINSYAGNLALTAGISLVSAMVVTGLSWRLYGRGAALLAGAMFAAGTAFALGYMIPTDALAVLVILASASILLSDLGYRYPAAGLLLGLAVVLKPLAILILPGMAYLLWREGKTFTVSVLIVFVLAPVAVFCLLAGSLWPGMSWDSLPTGAVSAVYNVPDALLAMLNLAAACAFVTITVVVVAASFLHRRASMTEQFLLISLLLLLSTLGFMEFTHYWFVALPFAAILCARLFSDDQKVIIDTGE